MNRRTENGRRAGIMARKAKKVMSQTFTLERFLTKINKEEIRSDQDVQRLSGQFNAAMINELIVTVLTDDYIPEIILGEEAGTNQAWIIDGLQRSSSLANFRFGNYKITSAIEDSEIEYERQSRDASGKVRRDADGNIIWETAIFDIRDKTYGELPDELKDQFNEYQLKTVIHQDCTMKQISKLVRRYNNHTGMNAMQKAFTYIDNYARDIRMLSEHRFFKDCGTFTEREHTRGIYNRVVCESVMAMFHMEQWKSSPKALCSYLNQYGTEEEFRSFEECLDRLEVLLEDCNERCYELFTSKNAFIWITLFYRFTKSGLEDRQFAEFLDEYQRSYRTRSLEKLDGLCFDEYDRDKGTKDKKVVSRKLEALEGLLKG